MNPFAVIKFYINEFKYWLKGKICGDSRPVAVRKQPVKTTKPKKPTTTRKKTK
jgi:hypothetical protein